MMMMTSFHLSITTTIIILFLISIISILPFSSCSDSGIPLTTSFRAFGPLPLGTRGASPLSVLGSDTLTILSTLHKFPSECATGGFATWRNSLPFNSTPGTGVITIPFDDAELPYESYAISNFTIPTTTITNNKNHLPSILRCSRPILIRSSINDHDDIHCSADVYDDGRAFCTIQFQSHVTYTILIFLASSANTTSFFCNYFYPPNHQYSLLLPLNDSVSPNIVIEEKNQSPSTTTTTNMIRIARLTGPHCSVTLLNIHDTAWATAGTARIIKAPPGLSLSPQSSADDHYPLPRLAPRQIRQLRLDLSLDSNTFLSSSSSSSSLSSIFIVIEVRYEFPHQSHPHSATFNLSIPISIWLKHRSYAFTYIDVDGSVQAAAVLPPSSPCAPHFCTVLLSTHGAGVDAIATAWTESYRTQHSAWVLLPTGRRKYGLNWEGPQMRTAITALHALVKFMPGVPPDVISLWKPRKDAWLQAGHSMGGHGALLLATHFPDMLLAALPAMGWLRLSTYGENSDSEDLSYSDAGLRALLAIASAEYNADLYAENLLGIPFLARVGSEDDNVPPSNLRKFCRLLKENEFFHNMTSVVGLSEVPGKGHWFDGVVDDDVLQPFLDTHLTVLKKPSLPPKFTLLTMNPGSSGSRGGLRIILQEVPFQISRLRITRSKSSTSEEEEKEDWYIQTENVRRIRYRPVFGIDERPHRLYLDGDMNNPIVIPSSILAIDNNTTTKTATSINKNSNDDNDNNDTSDEEDDNENSVDLCPIPGHILRDDERVVTWRICTKSDLVIDERTPDSYGPGFAVLSRRKVVVVYPEHDNQLRDLAVRYSNALYIRGISVSVTTDSNVTAAGQMGASSHGDFNTILLGGPDINRIARIHTQASYSADVSFYISSSTTNKNNTSLKFCIANRHRCFAKPGTGISFLSKGPRGTLLYYVAGTNSDGVRAALDWLPYGPSSNIPEWVIVSTGKGWGFRGLGGVIALGYWDNQWKLEPRKSYPAEFVFDVKTPGDTCVANTPTASDSSSSSLFSFLFGGGNDESNNNNNSNEGFVNATSTQHRRRGLRTMGILVILAAVIGAAVIGIRKRKQVIDVMVNVGVNGGDRNTRRRRYARLGQMEEEEEDGEEEDHATFQVDKEMKKINMEMDAEERKRNRDDENEDLSSSLQQTVDSESEVGQVTTENSGVGDVLVDVGADERQELLDKQNRQEQR